MHHLHDPNAINYYPAYEINLNPLVSSNLFAVLSPLQATPNTCGEPLSTSLSKRKEI